MGGTWLAFDESELTSTRIDLGLMQKAGLSEFDYLGGQRFDARRQYFYFKAGASRTQPLPDGFLAFGRVQGQIGNDPLLSSEQFSQLTRLLALSRGE